MSFRSRTITRTTKAFKALKRPKNILIRALTFGRAVSKIDRKSTRLNSSHITKDTADGPLTYKIIEKNGWKGLFVAITEILNSFDASSYIDYYPSTEKKRAQLIDELKTVQEQAHCDLFIVSVHTDEPEYIIKVTENHKAFFRKIIAECKADIIWANHPHVVKYFETVEPADSQTTAQNGRTAFIMYANGNTISAQRTNPQFSAPETQRDYTGDGFFIQVKFVKKYNAETQCYEKCEIEAVNPVLITTYIDRDGDYILKTLNPDLIKTLKREGDEKWASYLEKRMNLMNDTKGTVLWH